MKQNLSDVKVGDKLFSITENTFVEVVLIIENSMYPIKFISGRSCTLEGKCYEGDKFIAYYKENPFKEKERVIEVSRDNIYWTKRVLIIFKNNSAICWDDAETIKYSKKQITTSSWKYYQEIKENNMENENVENTMLDKMKELADFILLNGYKINFVDGIKIYGIGNNNNNNRKNIIKNFLSCIDINRNDTDEKILKYLQFNVDLINELKELEKNTNIADLENYVNNKRL
jgi:hypothetical protein